MPRDCTVFHRCGAVADGDAIDDLAPRLPFRGGVLRVPHHAVRSQMLDQLAFQDPTRLDKQTPINGLVRHPHGLVMGKGPPQPARYLLRRPIKTQFLGNDPLQSHVLRQPTAFGTTGPLPGRRVGIGRTVPVPAAMPRDLATHR